MSFVSLAARCAVSIVVACLLALACALPARAHSGAAPAGSERALRALEERVLGHAHAAAHARERRFLRSPAGRRAQRRRAAAPRARMASTLPAREAGAWQERFDLPIVGTHAVLLPTGKVLLFAAPVAFRSKHAHAYLWDPARGRGADAFTRVDPPRDGDEPVNLFGAGHSLMADGRVLVTGGTLAYNWENTSTNRYAGHAHAYTFDPFTERWQQEPDMRGGRWYPTQTLMPDGRTAIVSGQDASGTGAINEDVELFTPPAQGTGPGTITRVGSAPTWYSYPHLFWMPSGRLLLVGAYREESYLLDPLTPGVPRTEIEDPTRPHEWSSAVLMPGGPDGSTKVALLGGNDISAPGRPATDDALVHDEAQPGSGWSTGAIGRLNVPRQSHNTVILPDGGLVTVGGGSDGEVISRGGAAHRQVELLDPGARTWRLGAAQAETRAYHSTALLLPDGRVLSAGDDANGGGLTDPGSPRSKDTAEIYSPPYLFRGPRPTITDAPRVAGYGEEVRIGSPDPDVRRAVLVAPGAVTHSVNMSQRHVELEVVRSVAGQGVDVRTPPRGDLAPPGHYMLFLLDADGVPSVARFVRLAAPAPQPPVHPEPPRPAPVDPVAPTPPVEHRESSTTVTPPPPARLRVALDPALRRASPRPVGALTGTVVGLPGGARVEAALARPAADGRCRWWSMRTRRFATRPGRCATARGWAAASVRGTSWRLALGARVRRRDGLVAVVRVVGRSGRTLAATRLTLRR